MSAPFVEGQLKVCLCFTSHDFDDAIPVMKTNNSLIVCSDNNLKKEKKDLKFITHFILMPY